MLTCEELAQTGRIYVECIDGVPLRRGSVPLYPHFVFYFPLDIWRHGGIASWSWRAYQAPYSLYQHCTHKLMPNALRIASIRHAFALCIANIRHALVVLTSLSSASQHVSRRRCHAQRLWLMHCKHKLVPCALCLTPCKHAYALCLASIRHKQALITSISICKQAYTT